ncbi:MAG TPA: hypothetical protein VGI17_13970 [Solirubrobacterales bacterium]
MKFADDARKKAEAARAIPINAAEPSKNTILSFGSRLTFGSRLIRR